MRRKPTQRILSGLLSILMLCSIVMGTGAFTAFAEEAEPVVHAAEASTLEEGLILHSNFNDGAATDLSGNGHDGVVNGAVEFAEVEPGDLAVKITKQTKPCEDKVLGTDYVDYGKSADIIPATGDFSISLWYCSIGTTPSNTSVLGDKAYRSGSNTGICFGIVSSDLCYNFATSNSRVEMKGSTGNFGALKGCTSDETWHHLVCTFDRDGDMVGYVDGEKVGALSIASHVGRSVDAGLNLVLGAAWATTATPSTTPGWTTCASTTASSAAARSKSCPS